MTDEQIEVLALYALRRLEATKSLYDLLIDLKQNNGARVIHSDYTEDERKELNAIHKRHLLRRIKEEAAKAEFDL
jgi:hypothetical protein